MLFDGSFLRDMVGIPFWVEAACAATTEAPHSGAGGAGSRESLWRSRSGTSDALFPGEVQSFPPPAWGGKQRQGLNADPGPISVRPCHGNLRTRWRLVPGLRGMLPNAYRDGLRASLPAIGFTISAFRSSRMAAFRQTGRSFLGRGTGKDDPIRTISAGSIHLNGA